MRSILRLPCVKELTGRSRSSIYADIRARLFVKPVPIGARSVGWPSDEVDTIISARIAEKSDSEIRRLVSELEAARKVVA